MKKVLILTKSLFFILSILISFNMEASNLLKNHKSNTEQSKNFSIDSFPSRKMFDAIILGDSLTVELLLTMPCSDKKQWNEYLINCLYWAVVKNQLDIVELFIDNGINLEDYKELFFQKVLSGFITFNMTKLLIDRYDFDVNKNIIEIASNRLSYLSVNFKRLKNETRDICYITEFERIVAYLQDKLAYKNAVKNIALNNQHLPKELNTLVCNYLFSN